MNNEGLLKKYVWSTVGPTGILTAAAWAGFDQWRGTPQAWSTDGSGYGKRWASSFAASAIGGTTKYGVARLMHQDPGFVRCTCTGFGPRLRYGLAAPFKARTRDGRYVVSMANVAGLTAENVIPAMTWYPAPHGTHDGVVHAATGILSKMGIDVFREFSGFPRR